MKKDLGFGAARQARMCCIYYAQVLIMLHVQQAQQDAYNDRQASLMLSVQVAQSGCLLVCAITSFSHNTHNRISSSAFDLVIASKVNLCRVKDQERSNVSFCHLQADNLTKSKIAQSPRRSSGRCLQSAVMTVASYLSDGIDHEVIF